MSESEVPSTRSSIPELSDLERNKLMEKVQTIPNDVRAAFMSSYDAWRERWTDAPAIMDSSGYSMTQNLEFIDLVAQARNALPLLIEKLLDPDHHLALLVAERVIPSEQIPHFEPDDPEVSEGEQYRARLLVANWLASE